MAAVIRLMLFGVLALVLGRTALSHEKFRWLFSGIFAGAVFCAVIGLLDFYGLISLQAYRLGTTKTPGVLHSTFGNRGWFGEYILISVPFVLIGFMSRVKGKWWKFLLFGSLIICEIALILAGGRSGWVSYPLVLFVCWVFFWFSQEDRLESFHFRWKDLIKVAVSVPITIIISLIIVFYLFIPLSDHLKNDGQVKGIRRGGKATKARIVSQTARLIEPTGRLRAWTQGIDVGRESPLFGLGYEAFCWHGNILSSVPNSFYTMYKDNKHRRVLQTPHNIFFQQFVSGGVVGVFLWLVIVGYALIILTFDLIKNKRLLNTPVIICIISFHIFGIFQSMQYIPMIWLMIFLCLGYAMTVPEGVLPERLRRVMSKVVVGAMIVVGISFFFYLYNFESRQLAEKYDLNVYAMEPDRDRFAGFYHPNKRWKYGDYRWCGERGGIYFPEDGGQRTDPQITQITRIRRKRGGTEGGGQKSDVRSQSLVLEFHCRTPGLAEEPVVVTVYREEEVLDKVVFGGEEEKKPEHQKVRRLEKKKGKVPKYTVRRKYRLPGKPGRFQKLVIEVSRTWVPHEVLGNFDRREMGIGVKILKPEN